MGTRARLREAANQPAGNLIRDMEELQRHGGEPLTVYQPIERPSVFGRRQPISDNFAFREILK